MTSRYAISLWCYAMSCHVMYVTSCHVMLYHVKYVTSCYVMSCHVMLCHVMSCHAMPCHVMSCGHAMSCMSRHVMSCHVMSCMSRHVMSCHVMSYQIVSCNCCFSYIPVDVHTHLEEDYIKLEIILLPESPQYCYDFLRGHFIRTYPEHPVISI